MCVRGLVRDAAALIAIGAFIAMIAIRSAALYALV
jgi:hypothetical protein